jgi:hypothetical protein
MSTIKEATMQLVQRTRRKQMPENEEMSIPTTAVVTKKNGRTPKAEAAIEAGLAEFAAMREERDRIKLEYDRTMDMVTQAKDHIMRMQRDMQETSARCTAYQLERDEAVAKHAKLQGLFVSMLAQMRAFEIPVTPIIHELVANDAEAPKS